VVDDTGMAIAALGGLPGPLVAWFLERLQPRGIVGLLAGQGDRRAEVSTCIGYADERGARTFLGTVAGAVPLEPRGDGGFGYDSIFIPDGQAKTYAEMTVDEKNAASMRRVALEKLRDFLNGQRHG
jgi:XTP/dITP diphosphohydrolase